MSFNLICAIDDEFGIGKGGVLPWKYSEDLKFFKKTTMGSTCFMGKKTYLELEHYAKGKPELLIGRKAVVITHGELKDDRVTVLNDITKYKEVAGKTNFFIGGNSIFDFALDFVDTVYLTKVPGTHSCDTFFPIRKLGSAFDKYEEMPLGQSGLVVYVYRRD